MVTPPTGRPEPGDLFLSLLVEEARSLGIDLQDKAVDALKSHYLMLVRWSRSVRLVGDLSPQTVVRRHALESLSLLPWIHEKQGSLLDIGSGNGYPAIPLKCALPDIRVAMMEPALRKSLFLEHVIANLGLADTSVIRGRVDRPADLARHGRWDCISMRAVAAIPVVMAGATSALRPRGRLLLLVGDAGRKDIASALGQQLELLAESRFAGTDGSYIVVVGLRS